MFALKIKEEDILNIPLDNFLYVFHTISTEQNYCNKQKLWLDNIKIATIDNKLKFDNHIKNICQKASKRLNALAKLPK